jgi:hypothetical protein
MEQGGDLGDLDVKNKGGDTALHMATVHVGYLYTNTSRMWSCCQFDQR